MSKDEAEQQLLDLEVKWGKKYPVVIESWNRNWDKLSTFFKYPGAIRKLIYTTNTIEAFIDRSGSNENKRCIYFGYGVAKTPV